MVTKHGCYRCVGFYTNAIIDCLWLDGEPCREPKCWQMAVCNRLCITYADYDICGCDSKHMTYKTIKLSEGA